MTQDSNAGERDEPQVQPTEMEIPVVREPTPQEIAKAREAQEIADGHRYQTEEFRNAREAEKPVSDRKKARDDAKLGAKPGGKKDGPKKDMPPKATERIAKVLARAGLASRREVERLIGLGKIAVNGRILETPAVLVSSADIITVEGQVIGKADATRLWRYHKPVGLITTHSDPQGRPTLFEQLPRDLPRVISVGRLDLNSEGLLLLTNDGELARALEKPSSGWVRRYRVRALGNTTQARLDSLKAGTTVEGVIYGPMEASLDKVAEKADGRANVWLTVAITEGKNREVRKVLESIGLKVNRLIRLAYGPFLLGNLEAGEVEEVGPRVIRELLADVVPLKNLPAEGVSQTQSAPRERAPYGDAPAGRRGGGDRFKSDRPSFDKPRGDRPFGDKPRTERPYGDRPRPDRPSGGKPVFAEKREYKPRDFDERPRFEGDGEARDRRPETAGDYNKPYIRKSYPSRDSDPRAGFTPRPDRGAGNDRKPARSGDDAPAGEAGAYARAKREFGPKPGGAKAYGDRPSSDRPTFKKPYAARDNDGGARKPYGKPRFERSAGEGADARSTYTPRPDRDAGDKKPYAKKPYAARSDDGQARPPYAKKPYTPREGGDGAARPAYAKKPYAPREGGDGERRSYIKPVRSDRPREDRPQGDRPAYKGRDGAAGEGRKPFGRPGGDKPRGDVSKGPRSSAPRPGGKPGGKPAGSRPFNRKPRDS